MGAIPRKNARRKSTTAVLGACALIVAGVSPAAGAGIGDRIGEWPVATSLAAALVFGVLAIVFASLARAVREESSDADTPAGAATKASPGTSANGTAAVVAESAVPSLDRKSGEAMEPCEGALTSAETDAPPSVIEAAKRPGDSAPASAQARPAPVSAVAQSAKPDEYPVVSSAAPSAGEAAAESVAEHPAEQHPRATDADPLYPLATCRHFATGLGDEVLERALKLFQPLGQIGRLDSVQLAEMLDARPASLGGLLTTPLSRRADALGLPLPYVIDRVPGTRRRVWRDHAAIAERMAAALRQEIALRELSGAHAAAAAQESSNGETGDGHMVGRG